MFTKGHIRWNKGKTPPKKRNSKRNPGWFQPSTNGRSRILKSVEIPDTSGASSSYTRQSLQTPYYGGMTDCVCSLWPKESGDQKREEIRKLHFEMNRFYNYLVLDMLNITHKKHKIDSPSCPIMHVELYAQEKVGTCLYYRWRCINCVFIGNRMLLSKNIRYIMTVRFIDSLTVSGPFQDHPYFSKRV